MVGRGTVRKDVTSGYGRNILMSVRYQVICYQGLHVLDVYLMGKAYINKKTTTWNVVTLQGYTPRTVTSQVTRYYIYLFSFCNFLHLNANLLKL